MGLLNILFKKKTPHYGDLNKTRIIYELLQIPSIERNDEWKKIFLENVGAACFRSDNKISIGPDGFPYFELYAPIENQSFQRFVIDEIVPDYLLKEGFGISINPNKEKTDWVFSYGDIVNYYLKKEFYTKIHNNKLINNKNNTESLIAQPSESLLPNDTRIALKNALSHIGINDVKLFLLHRLSNNSQELVFNITPDKLKNNNELFDLAQIVISWHLPKHYLTCGANEEKFENDFCKL
jgi:hypothetical protein